MAAKPRVALWPQDHTILFHWLLLKDQPYSFCLLQHKLSWLTGFITVEPFNGCSAVQSANISFHVFMKDHDVLTTNSCVFLLQGVAVSTTRASAPLAPLACSGLTVRAR